MCAVPARRALMYCDRWIAAIFVLALPMGVFWFLSRPPPPQERVIDWGEWDQSAFDLSLGEHEEIELRLLSHDWFGTPLRVTLLEGELPPGLNHAGGYYFIRQGGGPGLLFGGTPRTAGVFSALIQVARGDAYNSSRCQGWFHFTVR